MNFRKDFIAIFFVALVSFSLSLRCEKGIKVDDLPSNDTISDSIIYNIDLYANPESLKIDTIRQTTIWAIITYNEDDISEDSLVPDSTLVSFSSSLGSITNQAYTIDGKAEAILQNNDTSSTGICNVLAVVKTVIDSIGIPFYK